jgi:hypothetical protein
MRVIQMTGPLDYPSGIPTRHIIAATIELAVQAFKQHHPGVTITDVYVWKMTHIFRLEEVKE